MLPSLHHARSAGWPMVGEGLGQGGRRSAEGWARLWAASRIERGSEQVSHDEEQLMARVSALEAELAELRATCAALRAEQDRGATVSERSAPPAPPAAGTPSRRLVIGGAVAGAAAALTGALAGPSPAAAASGTMQYGDTQDAGFDVTELTGRNSSYVLLVRNLGFGRGIQGNSDTSDAVTGSAQSGHGVVGLSATGIGMRAQATNGIGLRSSSNRTQIQLNTVGARPAPTGDAFAHALGDIVRDDTGDLWLCVGAGTPGTFRKLSGPATAGALHLLPAPVRIYDSRPGSAPAVGTKAQLDGGEVRTLDCGANGTGVPVGATGVLLTCMVVGAAAGSGNLTVWSNSAPRPAANTMVWGGSSGRASTLAVSAVDAARRIKVSSSLRTDLVVDVVGYHR